MSQERRSAMIGVGKNIGTVGKVHGKSSKGRGTSSGYHSKLRD